MIRFKEFHEACWDTHKQIGMKKKGNRMVPNCVPKNEEADLEESKDFSKYIMKPTKTEPKIVRKSNPAGRTTDHVEYEVHGTLSSHKRTFKSKKEAEAYFNTVKEEADLEEGAPIVVALAPIDVRNPKKTPQTYRNQGDIVPPTKPPSTEKRGVKGRPGQRPMPNYNESVDEAKDSRLANAGVEGYNKAKRTPGHPTKSHIVVAKDGDKVKTIRFGEQGASTAGDPKPGESDKMKAKRKSFKARHGKNIAKGKMSAAYWADKEKW